jgi:diacylglycerol kinase (ATP)
MVSNFKFIVNPMAANGRFATLGKTIHQRCIDEGIDFDIEYTKKQNDAIEIGRKSTNQFENIVAVGGDGTINEVVNGIVGSKSRLGVIPAGSGNDFINSLSIPNSFVPAFQSLIQSKTCQIDVGKVNDLYFVNGLGIGFDAWVVKSLLSMKKYFGKATYLYGVFLSIYNYVPVNIHLTYNNISCIDKYFMINVGNGFSMGGGFKLTPNAIPYDGLLDLNIVKNLTKIEILKNLIKVRSGKHVDMPQVSMARTEHLKVESKENFAAHIDGELISADLNSLDISILPKALDVIISENKNV